MISSRGISVKRVKVISCFNAISKNKELEPEIYSIPILTL